MTRYLLPALLLLLTHATQAKTYKVYYLGGQSNMAGYGNNAELNAPYNAPLPEVRMFNGNPAG
ncbi:MAG: sialate O-acetylesterase, partial [Aestuariibacter sp.]|nr:sialate O-acetylesterase [Aestuariibacter sp.]